MTLNIRNNIFRKRSIVRIIIVLNFSLFLHVAYKFADDIYTHKHEIQFKLKQDHLKYLGMLLLDYYQTCQSLPENINSSEEIQKCTQIQLTNANLTDIYNKPLFYRKNGSKAYIAYHENTAFLKTKDRIIRSVIVIDTDQKIIRAANLEDAKVSKCCTEQPPQ